jgi:dihydropteroate synthase
MRRASFGGIEVGDGLPAVVIGAINLSPESFFAGSVVRSTAGAIRIAREFVEEGAEAIDLGAMSTGPGSGSVPERVEISRLVPAVRALSNEFDVPISVDTQRATVAEEAIAAGAEIVNDISGLKRDPRMPEVIAKYGCSAILMATAREPGDVFKVFEIRRALLGSLSLCRRCGIPLKRVVLDPAIGAWPARLRRLGIRAKRRARGRPYSRAASIDLQILARLGEFRSLGRPICVGISRKSFVGSVLGLPDPADRLIGSLAATVVAILNGAHVVRTHDPGETLQAIRMAEAIEDYREG